MPRFQPAVGKTLSALIGGVVYTLLGPGTTGYAAIFGVVVHPTETFRQYRMPRAATIRKLWLYVSSNTINGNSVVTIRKNGVATSITVTIGVGLTGEFSDLVHSVDFAEGDKLSFELTIGGDAGGITLQQWSLEVT